MEDSGQQAGVQYVRSEEVIDITVEGEPYPQGSMVAGLTRQGRPYVRYTNNKNFRGWRNTVTEAVEEFMELWDLEQLTGKVAISVYFYFERPKSHLLKSGKLSAAGRKQPYPKKDLDKLIRSINDSVTDAGLWSDDSQVVVIESSKRWADWSGVRLQVSTVNEGDDDE